MAVRWSPKPLVGVRFPPWSPGIRGIGIIGNTVALQASVSGSIPLSSTKVSISILKVRSYNGIRADC